jgi:hypothetical protein
MGTGIADTQALTEEVALRATAFTQKSLFTLGALVYNGVEGHFDWNGRWGRVTKAKCFLTVGI